MTPKELYVQSRKAGYPKEQALERVRQFKTTGKVPVDPTEAYWDALIKQESGGDQKAVSPKGAVGRAQVMPKTAPEAAAMAGLDFDENRWRNDPTYNEAIGRAYLRKQFDTFKDGRLALAAYNAGPGAVRKAGGDISRLPKETQNYVPAIAGNKKMTPKEKFIQLRQQGYSKEEALAIVKGGQAPQQAAPQQPVPAPQQQPAPAPVPQQPMPQQQAPAAAQPTPTGAYLNSEMERRLQAGQGFPAGVQRSAANILTGGRQLFNQLTGDEEDLASLAEEQKQREALFQKYDPKGSGFSSADAGAIVGDIGTMGMVGGAKAAGQIGAGALEGALKPAESVGERLGNTATGAAVGSIGPLVSGLRGALANKAPIEAAKDFTTRAMNQAPGAPVMGAYDTTTEKVGGAADDIYKTYKTALQGAERAVDLPPVPLSNTAKEIEGPLGLEDELVRALSPQARKTIATVQGGSIRTSPILDETGEPIRDISERSFEDVRATLREIKNKQASFSKAGKVGAASQLEDLRQTLESDLDKWGYSAPGPTQSRASLENARAADIQYRDEVLPAKKLAEALKAPDGKSVENKLDSYLFGGTYAPGQSGTEVRKLLEVAPEVREPLRKILASKLNVPRGEQASARSYLGGTTAEALFSSSEREYMTKLADELQKNPTFLSVRLPVIDKALKTMGVGSVKPYDYVPLSKGPTSQKIINALRSAGIGTEEE